MGIIFCGVFVPCGDLWLHILVVRAIPESLAEDRHPGDDRVGLKEEDFMVGIFMVAVCHHTITHTVCHTVCCQLGSNTFQ